jgi:predicted ATP-dependent serine protease
MLTLRGAVPGAGKSFVALDLARRIIEGSTFPDGTPVGAGRPVVYVDAEAIPQVINERAENWKMDKSKLFLMLPDEDLILDLSGIRDQDRLTNMVFTIGPAMVVVDSLSSVSTKGENNIEDIRELLAFLNRLAVDYDCAMVLIHHLRKRGTQQLMLWDGVSIDDFRGSGHIIAMARSVLD